MPGETQVMEPVPDHPNAGHVIDRLADRVA
jgi:hypothetical protein